jgi:hypothetical protein
MVSELILSLAGALFFQGMVALDVAGQAGHLTVKAVDQFGQAVGGAKIAVRPVVKGVPGAVVEGWKNGDRLPYGRYLVESRAAGFHEDSVTVEVKEIASVVLVCHRFWVGESAGQVVVEWKRNYPGCPSARLLALYDYRGDSSREVWVVRGRSFTATDVRPGEYVAVVEGLGVLCLTGPVRVTLERPQRVSIE